MTENATDRKFANTLARGLRVLEAFTVSDDGLTHAQIAERTGLPKPTISRLTYTLVALGYLAQSGRHGRFFPGPSALSLGAVAQVVLSFADAAATGMQRLADQTRTLTAISVRHGHMMVIVRAWHPATGRTVGVIPGHRIPLLGSSTGQALVAALDDTRFKELKPDNALNAFRDNGYTQLLRNGFTVVPREMRYGGRINAVGVPYFAPALGQPVGFSCGGPATSLGIDQLHEKVGPGLRAVVHALEQRTGQPPAIAVRTESRSR